MVKTKKKTTKKRSSLSFVFPPRFHPVFDSLHVLVVDFLAPAAVLSPLPRHTNSNDNINDNNNYAYNQSVCNRRLEMDIFSI